MFSVHTCASVHQAVQFGTGQTTVTLCSWEGNHRSGVALAMCHVLSGLSTYEFHGHRKGDEHPAYTHVGYGTFTFTFTYA